MAWICAIAFSLNEVRAAILRSIPWLVILCFPRFVLSYDLPVVAIQSPNFTTDQLQNLQSELGIRTNEKLDNTRLEEGIRRLHSKEWLRTLFVEAVKEGEGMRVILSGSRARTIRRILYENVYSDVIEEVGVIAREGERSDAPIFSLLKDKILSAYERRGYYSARIELRWNDVVGSKESDVVVRVSPGTQTKASRVNIVGGKPEEIEKIQSVLPLRKGGPFSNVLLDESIETLTQYLKQNQYLTSKVEDVTLNFNEDKTVVEVNILLNVGEKLQFEFKGNTVLSGVEIRQLAGPNILSQPDAQRKVASQIESKYRRLGYHFIKVRTENISDRIHLVNIVRFLIEEGPKVHVEKITFWGESRLDPGRLETLFLESAPGVLKRRLYWEEGMADATEGLRARLESMGYLSATVSGPKVVFSEDRRGAELYFDVDSGVQTILKQVEIEGASQVSPPTAASRLELKAGEPLNREAIKDGKTKMLRAYARNGFIAAHFEDGPDFELSRDQREATIRLKLVEGTQYFVGDVMMEGNRRTKSEVILREMKLTSGDLYNPELVQQSEDDIAALGLFSRVEVAGSPNPSRSNARDLKVNVRESAPGLGELGLGAVYEDPRFRPRAFVGLGYKNLFGKNHTASVRSEVSLPISKDKLIPFVEYSSVLGYRMPYPFEFPFTFATQVGLDSFEVATDGPKIQTRARIEGKIEKKLSSALTAIYRLYRYERTTTEKLDNSAPTIREIIGSTGPGVIFDFRDDVFNPKKGSYHILDLEFAHPVLLSEQDISFLMALSRNSFYLPLMSTVGCTFYAGLGYAQSLLGKSLPSARLIHNLALGGRGSLRGFSLGRFQPEENSLSSAFYNLRAEVSSQLFSEEWSVAVFMDTGQIFPDLKSKARADGVGMGIRYKTPVGPVVLDVAQGLGEGRESMKFYFAVGAI